MLLQQIAIYLFCGAIYLATFAGLWFGMRILGCHKEFEQEWDLENG